MKMRMVMATMAIVMLSFRSTTTMTGECDDVHNDSGGHVHGAAGTWHKGQERKNRAAISEQREAVVLRRVSEEGQVDDVDVCLRVARRITRKDKKFPFEKATVRSSAILDVCGTAYQDGKGHCRTSRKLGGWGEYSL